MPRITNAFNLTATITLAAMSNMMPVVHADECCRWELRLPPTADSDETIHVELWAHVPDSAYAFASGVVHIRAEHVDWIDWEPCGPLAGLTSWGDPIGDDIENISASQPALPICAIDDNPIRIWCGRFLPSDTGHPLLSTETVEMSWYTDPCSTNKVSCDHVREASNQIFIGPDIFGSWFASYGRTTQGTPSGEGVVLEAAPGGVGVSASLGVIDPEDRNQVFKVQFDAMPPRRPVDLLWSTDWRCILPRPSLMRIGMEMEEDAAGGRMLRVSPDFSDAGVGRIEMEVRDGERVVATQTLPAGGGFSIFDPCVDPTWMYVPDEDGNLVLVLSCDSLFDVEVGGTRIGGDSVALKPVIGSSAQDGLRSVEVLSDTASALTIKSAGPIDDACRADCDGNGELNIFDFLCFQNLFASGDLAADFDGDGRLTIFDFLEFQNAFDIGCG
ncbi:hypothetical protein AY599_20820 [Leptolyngbya valderiana BDU 20041]|nr:hypothetical protein AY599_20820 [Leptolyngbya valderiana BDU 20041]